MSLLVQVHETPVSMSALQLTHSIITGNVAPFMKPNVTASMYSNCQLGLTLSARYNSA